MGENSNRAYLPYPVAGPPQTDLSAAVGGKLYLVCFEELFGRLPEALYFNVERPGDFLWSKYPRHNGGPTYGMSNDVRWFAELKLPQEFTHG